MTRDRLEYTQHCFRTLRENAGCEFDHFVLDQGSQDDTPIWLLEYEAAGLILRNENIGISRGHNQLLELAFASKPYDVVATFDNDCEVVMEGTLEVCAAIAAEGEWIVSPSVRGLNFTPQPGPAVEVRGHRVGPYQDIGGIFRVMPGEFARTFRFNEGNPYWGRDENDVGQAAAVRDIGVGYLLDWHVNHMDTTQGQLSKYPEYYARKLAEMR